MTFYIVEENAAPVGAVIKVIGVGGGGGNALNHMVDKNIQGVDFICANTDMQSLSDSKAQTKIQLGEHTTSGLGAGADPEVGRESANEVIDKIQQELHGSDMLFITAGLGGGTGTGAAPVIAEVAHNMDILTIAVVTKPFQFERATRMKIAEQGITELTKYVDSLITIPNDKLLTVLDEEATLVDSFAKANDVLYSSVQGIAELITGDGLINLDFADIKKVMSKMGMAMIGSGVASGEERAHEAAQAAINNPLLEDIDLQNVQGLLVNVTASSSLKMREYNEVNEHITKLAAYDAEIVLGTVIDEDMEDSLRVTMVATGFSAEGFETESTEMVDMPEPAEESVPPMDTAAKEPASLLPDSEDEDYRVFDKPAIGRSATKDTEKTKDKAEYDDYLDIPTFLRQQVD